MAQVEHGLERGQRPAFSRTYISRTGLVGLGVFLDVATITFVACLVGAAYHMWMYGVPGDLGSYIQIALLTSVFFVPPLLFKDKYQVSAYSEFRNLIGATLGAWMFAISGLLAVGFIGKVSGFYSRGMIGLFVLFGGLAVLLMRGALTSFVRRGTKTHVIAPRRIALVGLSDDIEWFQRNGEPWNDGLKVADTSAIDSAIDDPDELKALLQVIAQRLRLIDVDDIFICVPTSRDDLFKQCFEAFVAIPVAIHLGAPSLLDRYTKLSVQKIGQQRVVTLTPPPLKPFEMAAKRAFDIFGALVGIVLLIPVFCVVAFAIWWTTGNWPLFKQERHGFNRGTFTIYKFRTMTSNEDGDSVRQVTANDARITGIGAVLRRWNIDELPQLFNVLWGDMSLVGPRPHAKVHDVEFVKRVRRYARRHNMKPGITGLAQVSGYRGPTDNEKMLRRRIKADLYYIDNWSLLLDIIIIIRTVFDPKAFRNAF